MRRLAKVAELYGRDIEVVRRGRKEGGHSRRVRVYNCCLNMSFVWRHGGGFHLLVLVKYVEGLDCAHLPFRLLVALSENQAEGWGLGAVCRRVRS